MSCKDKYSKKYKQTKKCKEKSSKQYLCDRDFTSYLTLLDNLIDIPHVILYKTFDINFTIPYDVEEQLIMTFPVVSCPTRITKLPDIGTLYYIDIAILSVPYTINNVDFNNFYYLAPEYTPGIQTNTTIEMFTDCEYVKSTYLIKIDLIEDTPPPPPSPTLPSCFDIYYTRYNNTLPIDITLEGLPPNVKYQITQFPTTGILQILDMNNYVVDSLNNPTNTLTYTPLDNTVSVEFKYTVSNNETTTTDECSVFIFYDRDAINISAGRNFSYVLRTDNVLRTFGDNTCCQLADGSGSTMSDVPTTAILPFSGANIKDFDCGYNHSILHYYVNEGNDHKIFLIGDNTYGQLGIPQSTTKQCSFIETPLNNNGILDISAGAYHTCYIRNDNFNTHITGRNNKGQLGNGTYIDRYAFDDVLVKESKKISNLQDAIKVSCGFEHTGFITKATSISSTSVWLTGSNEFGQINQTNSSGLPGHMTTSVYALKAKDNIYFGNCIDISCGDYHTMLLDSNGQVYTFGNNVHGQLGVPLGPPFYDDYRTLPVSLFGGSKVIQISAGGRHSACLTEDGKVYMFGDNNRGQLGIGLPITSSSFKHEPTAITGITNAVKVECGYEHTIVLLEDGTVYTFGSNDRGALGNPLSGAEINIPGGVAGL